LLPRLDLKLPGYTVDTSFLKFSGVMEGWRLQTEYRIVADHFRRNKHLVNDEEENDGDSGESGERERSGESGESKVASSRQQGVDKENPAFAVDA
jgi:hypothetical protein